MGYILFENYMIFQDFKRKIKSNSFCPMRIFWLSIFFVTFLGNISIFFYLLLCTNLVKVLFDFQNVRNEFLWNEVRINFFNHPAASLHNNTLYKNRFSDKPVSWGFRSNVVLLLYLSSNLGLKWKAVKLSPPSHATE